MKRIVAIQHPQSQHHVNGMVGSWTDWPLTELGLAQAEAIGQKLAAELQGQDAVLYCSDLLRAQQTAEQIGRRLQLTPVLRKELQERNLGRCCGKSVQWLSNPRKPSTTGCFPTAKAAGTLGTGCSPFLRKSWPAANKPSWSSPMGICWACFTLCSWVWKRKT